MKKPRKRWQVMKKINETVARDEIGNETVAMIKKAMKWWQVMKKEGNDDK